MQEKNITAVLFDLDGTLVNSIQYIRQTLKRVSIDMNIPNNENYPLDWFSITLKEISHNFAGPREKEFFQKFLTYYHQPNENPVKLYPGTMEILRRVRERGMKTGLVTSKQRAEADRDVRQTGIGCLLDVFVTVDDVVNPKPHPEPVVKAMQMLRVKPAETVFIGDSCIDLEAGRAAGVEVIGVTWGICSAETLWKCGPSAVLREWSQLISYLDMENHETQNRFA